ncbi:YceD family protein [Companilactobacillus sp. DQM5]|uniref:YceD family protein n=1 Tax=Companilactobacillus sp. DQM5 TaxID=3463359 RepID=UPI0040583BF0
MLKWKLEELQKYKNHPMEFEETLDLKDELKRRDERIIDVKPITIKGHLFYDRGLWYTDFDINSTVTVPSTRSLEPVEFEINDHVTEAYQEDSSQELEIDNQEIVMELEEDGINLELAAVDNLLLSIPNKVLTEKEKKENSMPQGKNWQVISEEEYIKEHEKPKPNPEFAKLKDMFKDND